MHSPGSGEDPLTVGGDVLIGLRSAESAGSFVVSDRSVPLFGGQLPGDKVEKRHPPIIGRVGRLGEGEARLRGAG